MLDFIAALFALSFSGLVLFFTFLAGILMVKDLIERIKDQNRK